MVAEARAFRSRWLAALAVAALLSGTGCASVLNGTHQRVEIDSHPPGARAWIEPAGLALVTPADVELRRGDAHVVWVELPGYQGQYGYIDRRTSGALWGNLLLGGAIGILVDSWTGGAFALTPERLLVVLSPLPDDESAIPDGVDEEPEPERGAPSVEPTDGAGEDLERETGFEPATLSLGKRPRGE